MNNPLQPTTPATPSQASNTLVKNIAQGAQPAPTPAVPFLPTASATPNPVLKTTVNGVPTYGNLGGAGVTPALRVPAVTPASNLTGPQLVQHITNEAVPNPVLKTTVNGVPTYSNLGGAGVTPASNLTGPQLVQHITNEALSGLDNFKPTSVAPATPAPFTAQPMPTPNPLMFNPTARVPGVNNLTQVTAGASPMLQALMRQTTDMAKSGTLTGMPNYGQIFSGLAAAQNAVNGGSFTPADQSGAAGRASQMATQGAISANTLAQRQTQEYNSEQAAAQRMNAMIMNSANEAKLRSQIGLVGQLQQMLTGRQMANGGGN